MTAVIGILNKQAVAIAADSAVTVSGQNNRKIFNTANKIFTLSKFHPVGVMLYNSALFMYNPWETIIKVYRKQLGVQSYPTLRHYQEDFLRFLKDKNYFSDIQSQKMFSTELIISIFNTINNSALKNNAQLLLGDSSQENKQKIKEIIETKIEETFASLSNASNNYCSEFIDYQLDKFLDFANDSFNYAYEVVYNNNGINLSNDAINYLKRICYENTRSKDFSRHFSGLIFVGFGEDELCPALISLNVSGVIDNRLRCFVDEENSVKIDNTTTSCISPFAQTDVIDTILSGVTPFLNTFYIEQFISSLKKYNQTIVSLLEEKEPVIAERLKNLSVDDLVEEYKRVMENIQEQKYIVPLMNAVASLSKEDLGEMAESLIYLTYLKRRITFDEESVGGPVDVAVISKGDGFIWIKRKHYFKPELNQHFFANYFKTL